MEVREALYLIKNKIDAGERDELGGDKKPEEVENNEEYEEEGIERKMETDPIEKLKKELSVQRAEHAQSLLLNHNLRISEVAARVGYTDIYHFSKLFKKHLGTSPSDFRKC